MTGKKHLLEEAKKLPPDSRDEITSRLAAMGHPKRFRILLLLFGNPLSFQTLIEETELKKSALANHLILLQKMGLVEKIRHGTYGMTDEGGILMHALLTAYGTVSERRNKGEAQRREELARAFLERR